MRGVEVDLIVDVSGTAQIRTEFKPRGAIVLASEGLVSATLGPHRNGITTVRLTRHWEFLERTDIPNGSSGFDFSTELRGDLDSRYRITGFWQSDASPQNLELRINGALSSALSSEGTQTEGSDVANLDGLTIGYSASTGTDSHLISAEFEAATGQTRHSFATSSTSTSSGKAFTAARILAGKWADSTTQITSLGLGPSTGTIAAGSYFELYRKPDFAKSKITLWVY